MPETSQLAVHLEDYRPPSHRVDETHLTFDIRDGHTDVTSEMTLRAQSDSTTLVLDGQALELQSVAVDGRELTGNEYTVDDQHLQIFSLPEQCTVTVKTRIEPEANTALEGLYKSSNMYCTQCEAEGFRKITYYPDRPDVLSRFTTTIVADAERYPVLLSNGNLIDEGDAGDGRKRVTWRDPFPKPSYLFALVAGDLARITDTFTTASGRRVELCIYSEPHNISQCDYAMRSLKAAMRWDEERFGREYDLDIFMIVAVEDFNMGAMENKGLNVFNTSAVLASPATATDARHQRVEGVVAHEYFHNWSGNRVTCRDWFQLSLKEGFTVFRDAEFSSDMNSRTVKRIEDVEFLRTVQFDEDAGPLAHPVRPDSYVEISNFYTTTVYEKGAEVVRMLNTILGARRFRNACDLYFERHDGQAVTTEDFVVAMEEVGATDLVQFRRWYTQSGTPVLEIRETRKNGRIELRVSQSCPATPGQASKADFHIPVAMGVVDGTGREVLGQGGLDNGYAGTIKTSAVVENPNSDGTLIVHLTDAVTDLVIENLPTLSDVSCEVSFLRGFSAPVRVDYPRSPDVLCFLAQNDTDGFARWDVAQTLSIDAMLGMLPGSEAATAGGTEIETLFAALIERALHAPDDGEAKAVLAAMLTLPSVQTLLDRAPGTDVLALADVRDQLITRLAARFPAKWKDLYESNGEVAAYSPDGAGVARRRLKNLALRYLVEYLENADPPLALRMIDAQMSDADNLNDRLVALHLVVDLESIDDVQRRERIDAFYQRYRNEAGVVDLWFSTQAGCQLPGTLQTIEMLESHPAFDIKNPNKVRALYGGFVQNSLRHFHAAGGTGYRFFADRVLKIDRLNPQVAARLATQLTRFQRVDSKRADLMRAALRSIDADGVSKDLREVVTKGLAGDA